MPSPPGQPNLPVNASTQTHAPGDARLQFDTGAPARLSEAKWAELSNDLSSSITAATSARKAMDDNLKAWSDAYDLIGGEKDFPYVDSSNVKLPYIPAQVESVVAYVAGQVFKPRSYLVTGNTRRPPPTLTSSRNSTTPT